MRFALAAQNVSDKYTHQNPDCFYKTPLRKKHPSLVPLSKGEAQKYHEWCLLFFF